MSKKVKQPKDPKKLTKQQEFLLQFTPKQIDLAAKAALTYLLRRERVEHPDGRFDKRGRWFPSEKEDCDCCASVRTPSNAYPYSYLVHARSLEHIAWLHCKPESPQDFTTLVRKCARVAPSLEKTVIGYSEYGLPLHGARQDTLNAWVAASQAALSTWQEKTHKARKAALRKKKAIEKDEVAQVVLDQK